MSERDEWCLRVGETLEGTQTIDIQSIRPKGEKASKFEPSSSLGFYDLVAKLASCVLPSRIGRGS